MAYGRDRTTAAHALRKIEERREADPSTDLAINHIEAEVQQTLGHLQTRMRLGV